MGSFGIGEYFLNSEHVRSLGVIGNKKMFFSVYAKKRKQLVIA